MEDELVYIGKIVNTHGIKGELRLLSDFKYKDRVFLQGRRIYIGEEHKEEVIKSYRHHKIFDMITLVGYTNINEELMFKNKNVYVKKFDLSLNPNEYLESDLINLNVVLNDVQVGKIVGIEDNGHGNKTFEAIINNKKTLIPYHEHFIKNIDFNNKTIELREVDGLF